MFIITSFLTTEYLKYVVEMNEREQARYNLKQAVYCIDETTKEGIELYKSFAICTGKMKTSTTGDVYVFNAKTLEFVSETSNDVPLENRLFFTKESVGKGFNDWQTGLEALNAFLQGKDSEVGQNIRYLYDEDWEWSEWKYYPKELSRNNSKEQIYIIVQGTQADEIIPKYHIVKIMIFILTAIGVVCTLIFQTNLKKSNKDP